MGLKNGQIFIILLPQKNKYELIWKKDKLIFRRKIYFQLKKIKHTDQEIFLRELVPNAVDATTKLKKLASIGEFKGEIGDTKIDISIDKKNKTITITDRGIGMSADEVKKYINQVAFSGAEEFVQKYKEDKKDSGIIGHFGLGFYSSFMVSKKVVIKTKSFRSKENHVFGNVMEES